MVSNIYEKIKELKTSIEIMLEPRDIDIFLEYHAQNLELRKREQKDPEFESDLIENYKKGRPNKIDENILQIGLERIIKDLENTQKRKIYNALFDLGTDKKISPLLGNLGAEVLDDLSSSLIIASEVAEIPQTLEIIEEKKNQYLKQGLEPLSYHLETFFKLLEKSKKDASSEEVKRIVRNINNFSFDELFDIDDLINKKVNYPTEEELTNRSYFRRYVREENFNKLEVLKRLYKEFAVYNLETYFKIYNPQILTLTPKAKKIKKICADLGFSPEETISIKELEELFDFSYRREELSKEDIQEYSILVSQLKNRKLIKKIKEKDKHIRILEKNANLVEVVNNLLGEEYLTPKDLQERDASNLISRHKTLFSYYSELLKIIPDSFTSYKGGYIAPMLSTSFIDTELIPLYLLDKSGVFSLEDLRKLIFELNVSLTRSEEIFTDYITDFAYIFAFGKKASAEAYLDFQESLNQDIERSQKGISNLKALRREDSILYDTKLFDYLTGLSKYSKKTSIVEVSEELLKNKHLGKMLVDTPETSTLIGKISEHEKSLKEVKKFLNTTSEFYDLLISSCSEEEILSEYKGFVKKLNELEQEELKTQVDINASYLREIFKKYNAPATFEEQHEVAKTLIHAISGKELKISRTTVKDLIKELPFGGGVTVQLPAEISLFKAKRDNAHFYNLLAFLHGGMHTYKSYTLEAETLQAVATLKNKDAKVESVSDYFALFPNYELAESIFITAEQRRLFSKIIRDYPGLEKTIQSYFKLREEKKKSLRFENRAEEILFQTYNAEMLELDTKDKLRILLGNLKEALSINDTLHAVEGIYQEIEETCKFEGNPVPQKGRTGIDPRVLEELLKAHMKNIEVEYETAREGPYYTYIEYSPKESIQSVVYENQIPKRQNQVMRTLLEKKKAEVVLIREQLELLAPRDVYLQRKKLYGHLDKRALTKYQQDIKLGKVPNPRIFYKKIIEKRDVATIFALNMNREINQSIQGIPPRQVMQEMMGAFLEGSRDLGDSLGIYGFTSTGRENVNVYVFKDIHEPLSEEVYQRLAFFGGRDNNRNGAVYRHFTRKLEEINAKNKFFIEVCATYEPSDILYKGEDAVTDSKLAMNAMRLNGIQALCISLVDNEKSKNGLKAVYGDQGYIITNPKDVYASLSQAYTKLTV